MSPENAMQDHYDRMNDARDAEIKEVRLAALRDAQRTAASVKIRGIGGDAFIDLGVSAAASAIQALIDEASK